MTFTPKRLLVTGGAGFIGSNFIRHTLESLDDIHIVNIDRLTYAGHRANLDGLLRPERHHLVHGDICDRDLVDRLLREHDIDTVVHFAAESHVDRSIAGPAEFVRTNVIGTFTLLEAVRHFWLPQQKNGSVTQCRFHHISTDEVYGSLSHDDAAFTEHHPYQPNSPYSASKAGSDHLVRAYFHTYGLPVTTTNCSNNYGPYHFPEKLIPLIILNALNRRPLPIYGDGQNIRDWLYVTDHARAIWRVLQDGVLGETYNVGGWNEMTNFDVVTTICRILDDMRPLAQGRSYREQIVHVTDRPGHDRRYAIDASRLERELAWKPLETFQTGIRKTIDWYLNRPDWLEQVTTAEYRTWIETQYPAVAAS